MNNNSIGIIGCGWLGLALAKKLIANQVNVVTTVRTPAKQQSLQEQGINCQLLDTNDNLSPDNPVFSQDIIVIAITPGFKQGRLDYADNVKRIVHAAEQNAEQKKVQKIILLSSTGIYLGMQGEVDEYSEISALADKTKIIKAAEDSVIHSSSQGMVLRLAGLVGEDRLPGKFLAGKKDLLAGGAVVNLIHQQDAVGLLVNIIGFSGDQQIFVGVSNTQAKKAKFYQQAAKVMKLTPPKFVSESESSGHQVNGDLTRHWLSYQYQFDDLYHWLDNLNFT